MHYGACQRAWQHKLTAMPAAHHERHVDVAAAAERIRKGILLLGSHRRDASVRLRLLRGWEAVLLAELRALRLHR